jgi:hypothetical protein
MTRATGISNPNSPHALAVTDGTTTVGAIVPHDESYFAFDVDDVLVGEYATQREAMRAIRSGENRDNPAIAQRSRGDGKLAAAGAARLQRGRR